MRLIRDRRVLTLVATGIRAISALVLQKLVALLAGPAGLALMAQGQNIIAIATALPLDGLARGVVQQAGQAAGGVEGSAAQLSVLQRGGPLVILAGVLCALAFVPFAYLQGAASGLPGGLESPVGFGLSVMVGYLALASALVVPGQYWLARQQAVGRYGLMTWVLALASLAGIILGGLTLILHPQERLLVAIPMAAAASVLPLGLVGLVANRRRWISIGPGLGELKSLMIAAKPLLLFAAGALLAGRLADYYVRSWAIVQYGREAVGQWQAAVRLGDTLAVPATALFSGVFFPMAALLQADYFKLRRYALVQCLQILGWAMLIVGLLVALAEPLVAALYSDSFELAPAYFLPQAPGEVLRLASLPLTFGLMASGRAIKALVLELASLAAYLIAITVLTPSLGLLALPCAYTARYVVFFFLSLGAWRGRDVNS